MNDTFSFGEKVLALLEEGTFTATYKFAVLLALIDLCIEQGDTGGRSPETIATRLLAEKIIEIYWPHSRDFVTPEKAKFLRQNAGGQAQLVSAIRRFRERYGEDPLEPLSRARQRSPGAFERLVQTVELKLIELPLPRLQNFGRGEERFLYDFRWNPKVKKTDLRAIHFDRRIHLKEGVADNLIQLSGLLRPLVQRRWAAMIARLNSEVVQNAELEDFLFGRSRVDLTRVREPLRRLQENRCLYCRQAIRGPAEVDHFIPWSRHPDDGIENLVVTDSRCNSDKADHFASLDHLERWYAERFEDGVISEGLIGIAEAESWQRDPGKTLTAARSLYKRLRDGATLWSARGQRTKLNARELDRIFSRP